MGKLKPINKRDPDHRDEEYTLRRAKELAAHNKLPQFSMDDIRATIPADWKAGEADVDDFLNSIRGNTGRRVQTIDSRGR